MSLDSAQRVQRGNSMIAIIDYDAGNLKSVEKALNYLGEDAIVTRDYRDILTADKVILPSRSFRGGNGANQTI